MPREERPHGVKSPGMKKLFIAAACCFLLSAWMAKSPGKEDVVIFRDPGKYACFPALIHDGSDKLWVRFGWNTTRRHYGAADGGASGDEVFFSPDGGKNWVGEKEKGFDTPPENYNYFKLGNGILAMCRAEGHETLSKELAAELGSQGVKIVEHPNGNFTAAYRASASRSTDGGKTWSRSRVNLPKLKYILNGFIDPQFNLCDDKTILVPFYGRMAEDTADRSFVLRSADKGLTWQLVSMAYDGLHDFNETSILFLKKGRVIAQIRCDGKAGDPQDHDAGFIYQVDSNDRGATWSKPKQLPMWGYPPYLIRLRDGLLLSTYGYRRPPYGIRACFSHDGGKTWDWKREAILRCDGLSNNPAGVNAAGKPGDLGYPVSTELKDGMLFTVYYFTLGDGVTHIAGTRWSRDYVGGLPHGTGAAAR
jgi:hypothetical protein